MVRPHLETLQDTGDEKGRLGARDTEVEYDLLLTLAHCAFLQYTHKPMANVPFHTLHALSGRIFLKPSETQTLLFLSNPP